MLQKLTDKLYNITRMPGWWMATALSVILLTIIAPHQLAVVLYKVLLVTLGVSLGYLADNMLYRKVVGTPLQTSQARVVSRALIVLGVLLALSMGL